MKLLSARDVADHLGVCKVTAAKLMLEMNPINVGLSARNNLRVSDENFALWMRRRAVMQNYQPETKTRENAKKQQKKKPDNDSGFDEFGRIKRR